MLKFRHLPALLMMIFTLFFTAQALALAAEEIPTAAPDPAALFAQAQAEQDPAAALILYCAAARAGSGPAQLHIGRLLVDQAADTFNIAAGMLWLDAAIISGQADARDLRRAAGRLASPKDFERYRTYNNSKKPIPCAEME